MTTPIPCRHCAGPKPVGSIYENRVYCSDTCRVAAKDRRRSEREAKGTVGRNQWSEREHACPGCQTIGMLTRVRRGGRNRWLCQVCASRPVTALCETCEGMPWRRETRGCSGCGLSHGEERLSADGTHLYRAGNLARAIG